MDVADWLRDLGLEQYEAAFRENDVNAEVLCHLTAEDLKELGVSTVGHRRQLLVAIAKLGLTLRRCGRSGRPASPGVNIGGRTAANHGAVLRYCGLDAALDWA